MHTSSEKKIKIILLASGYNELQEGNTEYRIEKVTNQFKKTRQFELNFKFNRIYITPNPSNPYNLTLLIKGQLRTSIEDSSLILSEPILENTELTSLQEQEIINFAKQKNYFQVNPFVETARQFGYQIEIESIDFQHPPIEAWNHPHDIQVHRIQASLDPQSEEEHQVLNTMVQRWRSDIQEYDGLVFINTDGDGFIDKRTYWPIYLEFEKNPKIYFAEWCTCCLNPVETSSFLTGAHYAYPQIQNAISNPKSLFIPSPLARSLMSITSQPLKEDFKQWLMSLNPSHSATIYKRYGLYCEPCEPNVQEMSVEEIFQGISKDWRTLQDKEHLNSFSKEMIFKMTFWLTRIELLPADKQELFADFVKTKFHDESPDAAVIINYVMRNQKRGSLDRLFYHDQTIKPFYSEKFENINTLLIEFEHFFDSQRDNHNAEHLIENFHIVFDPLSHFEKQIFEVALERACHDKTNQGALVILDHIKHLSSEEHPHSVKSFKP